MSVAQAQREISSIEFTHWIAYAQKNLLASDSWEQAALICSVTANVAGNKTRPNDFLPLEKPKKKAQTPEEMAAVLEGMFGGN